MPVGQSHGQKCFNCQLKVSGEIDRKQLGDVHMCA